MFGHLLQRHARSERRSDGAQLFEVRFPKHLDVSERVVPIIGAKVEIVDRQSFFKDGGILVFRQRQQRAVVMAHVKTPHHVRGVRQAFGMFVARRP